MVLKGKAKAEYMCRYMRGYRERAKVLRKGSTAAHTGEEVMNWDETKEVVFPAKRAIVVRPQLDADGEIIYEGE